MQLHAGPKLAAASEKKIRGVGGGQYWCEPYTKE
jgi:hypothetical protein